MRTYRELFRTPEFAPLFVASCAQVAATTLAGLSLATLVYARTDSPLLSALSMFGPSVAGLIGATTLLSVADRVPPRTAMTLVALAAAVTGLLLAAPGLPARCGVAADLAGHRCGPGSLLGTGSPAGAEPSAAAGVRLRRPRVKARIEQVTGLILATVAVRLATASH